MIPEKQIMVLVQIGYIYSGNKKGTNASRYLLFSFEYSVYTTKIRSPLHFCVHHIFLARACFGTYDSSVHRP